MKLEIIKNKEFGSLELYIDENGRVFFPATECAQLLGYKDPHKAIKAHTKEGGWVNRPVGVVTGNYPNGEPIRQTVNKKYISEGNLYRLIVRSNLHTAQRFEEWIFDEVLPSIRQNGFYIGRIDGETMVKIAKRVVELEYESDLLFLNGEQLDNENKRLKEENGDLDEALEVTKESITQLRATTLNLDQEKILDNLTNSEEWKKLEKDYPSLYTIPSWV